MVTIQEVKHVLFDESNIKWIWTESELNQFREMWNEKEDIFKIAKAMNCNRNSAVLLVIDQAQQGFIKQRKNGLF